MRDDPRARYRNLPEWVQAIITRHVEANNAGMDPKDRFFFNIHPRDIVNMDLVSRRIADVRRRCIRDIDAVLRADGRRPCEASETIQAWFGCGQSLITVALKPEQHERRLDKKAQEHGWTRVGQKIAA